LKVVGPLVPLACLLLVCLHLFRGAAAEGDFGAVQKGSRCAQGSEAWRVYDDDAGHLWNRLYRSLYLRAARDGREFGRDEVDPLLWSGTSEHLLGGESYAQASACLDEFLDTRAERLVADPLKRAMLQRDLWAVFDWTAQRSERPTPELQELRRRLAAVIRRLALSPAQIDSLPDTYRAAAASGAFAPDFDPRAPDKPFLPPDLFQTNGPWVLLGVERGEPVPTGIVESVQLRIHRALPAEIPAAFDSVGAAARASLSLYEFRLSRARLFAGESGGLRAVARDEQEFPLFQSHGIDPFESQGGRDRIENHLSPVRGSCVACHFRPGIHSVLSRTPDITQLRLRDVRRDLLPAQSYGREADITKAWKMRQESWRLLRELWEQAER